MGLTPHSVAIVFRHIIALCKHKEFFQHGKLGSTRLWTYAMDASRTGIGIHSS